MMRGMLADPIFTPPLAISIDSMIIALVSTARVHGGYNHARLSCARIEFQRNHQNHDCIDNLASRKIGPRAGYSNESREIAPVDAGNA